MLDIHRRALDALLKSDAAEKARMAETLAEDCRSSALHRDFQVAPLLPLRPGRPARPILRPPGEMARRKIGASVEKRAAMIHALAHIELNAIDLAIDMAVRFDDPALPEDFVKDWICIAGEEALHFRLLRERLQNLGFDYGDFPAHDGLWEAAIETRHDPLARLAVVPLVLEARGLDITPKTIEAFAGFGDAESAKILAKILEDEIGHVAAGLRWFRHIAERQDNSDNPADLWRGLVNRHFKGQLKPPFNQAARDQAGMTTDFYDPIPSDGAFSKS